MEKSISHVQNIGRESISVIIGRMDDVLLSVVVPVYNGSGSLRVSLESVLNQDFQDLELVCVDDGSTDDTAEVLQKFAAGDPRVKIISHKTNLGRMEARRTGAKNAAGQYLMFLDADDTFDQGLCGSCVDLIRQHGTDMVQFTGRQINEETGKTELLLPYTERLSGQDILKAFFISRTVPTTLWLKIYRTQVVQKAFVEIPELRSNMGEDVLISYFIAYYADSFIGIQTRQKYNYYFGSGISSDKDMPIGKYAQYCEMSSLPGIALDFVKKCPENDIAREAANCMTVRLLMDCASMFVLVSEREKAQAAEIFQQNWNGMPDLMKYILQAFAEQKQYIDTIYASTSYRLGNRIILPLRSLLSDLKSR